MVDAKAVVVDGFEVGHVFQIPSGVFMFVLDDDRETPRGVYDTQFDAEVAAEGQHRCLVLADRWELMLDT